MDEVKLDSLHAALCPGIGLLESALVAQLVDRHSDIRLHRLFCNVRCTHRVLNSQAPELPPRRGRLRCIGDSPVA